MRHLTAPLLPFTLLFMAGIIVQGTAAGWWYAGASALLFALLLILRHPYAAISSTGLAAGVILSAASAPESIGRDTLSGHWSGIVTESRETAGGTDAVVTADSVDGIACIPVRILVYIRQGTDLSAGDRMDFSARVYPLVTRLSHPEEDDLTARIRRQGVSGRAYIIADSISSIRPARGILNGIHRLGRRVTRLLVNSDLDEATASFLTATLTGDREYLLPDTRDMFSTAGIAHILALSGLHVALIAAIIAALLSPLYLFGLTRVRNITVILLLWLFAVFTGLSPSVVRAVVMMSLYLLSVMLGRNAAPLNSLCFASLVILVFEPFALYGLGFQMSFCAVISIIIFVSPLSRHFPRKRKFLRAVCGFLAVSLAAVAGTALLSAWHFGFVPLYFLVANAVCSVILPVLLGGGILLVILLAAGIPAGMLCWSLDLIYSLIHKSAEIVSSLPGATIEVPAMSMTACAAYLVILTLLAIWINTGRRAWGVAAGSVAAVTLITAVTIPRGDYPDEMIFDRDTRGFSALVHEDSRLVSYAGAGHRSDPDHEMRFATYMRRRGIDRIETRRLRHGDVISFAGRRYLFVSHHREIPRAKADAIILGRSFYGNRDSLLTSTGADHVILSGALSRRYVRRLLVSPEMRGINVTDLRRRMLSVTQSPSGTPAGDE